MFSPNPDLRSRVLRSGHEALHEAARVAVLHALEHEERLEQTGGCTHSFNDLKVIAVLYRVKKHLVVFIVHTYIG